MLTFTKDLAGRALDWAVSDALHAEGFEQAMDRRLVADDGDCTTYLVTYRPYSPSTNPAQGGPLIDKFYINLRWDPDDKQWIAEWSDFEVAGETRLVAAMRMLVMFATGSVADVPDELTEVV